MSDPAASVTWHDDVDGNRQAVVRLAQVPRSLELLVNVAVERSGAAPLLPEGVLRDERYRRPSALTRPDARILALAAEHRTGNRLETADRLCAALAGGVGVCQKQAHLMLALCRAAGVPARYVSGHLVGQGGTHAWVEVLVPDGLGARAVAYDPCHGRRADRRYVTVAVGRDYRDVPPTSGWYSGSGRGCCRGSACWPASRPSWGRPARDRLSRTLEP